MFHVKQRKAMENADELDNGVIVETIPTLEAPRRTFLQAIAWMLRGLILPLFHPKILMLTTEQAEYVQELFLAGSTPEAIGRAMNSRYKRTTWQYFANFDKETNRYKFDPADYEMDGLEYIWATMHIVGALVKRRDGEYYQTNHPMVKRLASEAVQAPIPKKKEG